MASTIASTSRWTRTFPDAYVSVYVIVDEDRINTLAALLIVSCNFSNVNVLILLLIANVRILFLWLEFANFRFEVIETITDFLLAWNSTGRLSA